MDVSKKKMATIFDEWAKRYAEDPKSFGNIVDKDGNPVVGYGKRSAEFFTKIMKELDSSPTQA